MAEQVTLNVNVETGEAVKNLGDLEKATKGVAKSTEQAAKSADSLEDRFDQLNKEIKEGPVNIRKMNKQIQEYQAIALEAGRTSPLGKQAIAEAAALKDRYNDITAEVNRLANDGVKLQAALDLGTSITAGYTAFQGAMALSGVESEKLQETLVKLQAAQSVLIGVETIRKNLEKESTLVLMAKNAQEKAAAAGTYAYAAAQGVLNFVIGAGSKALKLFRLALISTGIGAIIVGIGMLIANFGKIKEVVMDVINFAIEPFRKALQFLGLIESDQEKARRERAKAEKKRIAEERKLRAERADELKKQIKEEEKLRDRLIKKYDDEIRIAKSLGKETVKIEKEKLEALIESFKLQKQLFDAQFELRQQNIKSREAEFEAQLKENNFFTSKIAEVGLQRTKEANEKLLDEQQENNDKLKDAEIDLLVFENEIATERRKEREKVAEAEKKLMDQILEANEKTLDSTIKTEQQKREEFQKLFDEIGEEEEELTIENIEEVTERGRMLQQLRAEQINDEIEQERTLRANQARFDLEDKLEQLRVEGILTSELRIELEKQTQREITQINKEADQQRLENKKAFIDAGFDLALSGIDALLQLNDAFSGETEAQQRQAFERAKKLQIAQALISSAQGVVNILSQTSTIPQPFSTAYKVAQIGILAATTAAQVAKINQQKFNGGGVSAPNISSGGGGVGAPQIAPVTNTSTLLGQEPQQVFVTETDITNTQNQVAVIETQATIK
jgi:hypothetical protein